MFPLRIGRGRIGGDPDRAKAVEVLADDLYAAEVREAEALWRLRGISAVPAVVVEGKWLISGGQPAAVFEEALQGGWQKRGNSLKSSARP